MKQTLGIALAITSIAAYEASAESPADVPNNEIDAPAEAEFGPSVYLSVFPLLGLLSPEIPNLVFVEYEHPIARRLSLWVLVTAGYGRGLEVRDLDNRYDMTSVGGGVGLKYYLYALGGQGSGFAARLQVNTPA